MKQSWRNHGKTMENKNMENHRNSDPKRRSKVRKNDKTNDAEKKSKKGARHFQKIPEKQPLELGP